MGGTKEFDKGKSFAKGSGRAETASGGPFLKRKPLANSILVMAYSWKSGRGLNSPGIRELTRDSYQNDDSTTWRSPHPFPIRPAGSTGSCETGKPYNSQEMHIAHPEFVLFDPMESPSPDVINRMMLYRRGELPGHKGRSRLQSRRRGSGGAEKSCGRMMRIRNRVYASESRQVSGHGKGTAS